MYTSTPSLPAATGMVVFLFHSKVIIDSFLVFCVLFVFPQCFMEYSTPIAFTHPHTFMCSLFLSGLHGE